MARYRNFAFRPEYYTIAGYRSGDITLAEYRAEYKRLYDVARKRLKAFERAGMTESVTYTYNKERVLPISKLAEKDLPYALQDVYRMLTSRRGSVSGIRAVNRKVLAKLHEGGYYRSVTSENLTEFGDFMDWWRESAYSDKYDSERVAMLYNAAEASHLSPGQLEKNFEKWMEDERVKAEIERLTDRESEGDVVSVGEWKRAFRRKK